MSKNAKKWLTFTLRWGIAVLGITYVLWNLHFRDHVQVLTASNEIVELPVVGAPEESAAEFRVRGAIGEAPDFERVILREQVWTRPNQKSIEILRDPRQPVTLIAIRPPSVADGKPILARLLIQDPQTKANLVIDPSEVVDPTYQIPSYPLIEMGLIRMTRQANGWYLLAALMVMPLSYLLTSYRWHVLLETLEIHIGMARTFVINMVGAFYNSFMPGSTGGDVAKAYYAAKHTDHRTRAVMSVIVDRVIGLLALIMLGGAMSALQYNRSPDCRRVAQLSGLFIALTIAGLLVFYNRGLRRRSGLDWVLNRLPMQRFVHNVVHALELYGRRPRSMILALLLCFPVHITTIVSASLSGKAFGLPLDFGYYWVIVPVIALVGAIPISPQGAGVMEFFAIQLTKYHNATVGQAVALVMSIRLIQISWNLVAGIFVLRGGYHAPTEAEAEELETDDEGDELTRSTGPADVQPNILSQSSSQASLGK